MLVQLLRVCLLMGITTVSLCEAFADWDVSDDGDPVCGEPAIATVTVACLHEHTDESGACAGCATDLQRSCQGSGAWQCVPCAESASPHDCIPLVRIDWHGGERTIVQEAGQ